MLRLYLMFVLLGFLYICTVESARILAVLPIPSISHQVVFRPLMHELAKRGHEVVIITTDPAFPKGATPANLTEIDLHDVSYKTWREQFLSKKNEYTSNTYNEFKDMVQVVSVIFDKQLENDEVQKLLRDKTKTFDLLFIEACHRTALSFTYVYKAPVILISSFGPMFDNVDVIGAPVHPILYPSLMHHRTHDLTMWEKISELCINTNNEVTVESLNLFA